MIIKERGKYRLLKRHKMRNSIEIRVYKKGYEFEVTMIDTDFHKVIGNGLPDWQHWDMPVEKINEED